MTNYVMKQEKVNSIPMIKAKRVYRWNPLRLLINVAILMVIVALMIVVFSINTKANTEPQKVIVHPGDTLWSIALAAHPEHDPRCTVETIRDANHMNNLILRPGQQIVVP